MYMTQNVFERYATYYDLPDKELFHFLIEKAKANYNEHPDYFDELTEEDLANLKRTSIPVLFASKVASQKNDDFKLMRADMNERATRKYLIIDADFDQGEDAVSQQLYDKIIEVAEQYKTPLVIYPTTSYPAKPRFRAVMFSAKSLNEATYHQAMSWWYDQLGVPKLSESEVKIAEAILTPDEYTLYKGLDASNKNIRSNNNAPYFTNAEQLQAVVDTTKDSELKPLDNTLWKSQPKPRVKRKVSFGKLDATEAIPITDADLERGCREFARTEQGQDFNTFWKFLHTLARAEINKQLTPDQIDKALDWVAYHENPSIAASWRLGNRQMYKIEYNRVASREDYFKNARPLLNYKEFRDILRKRFEVERTDMSNAVRGD